MNIISDLGLSPKWLCSSLKYLRAELEEVEPGGGLQGGGGD